MSLFFQSGGTGMSAGPSPYGIIASIWAPSDLLIILQRFLAIAVEEQIGIDLHRWLLRLLEFE